MIKTTILAEIFTPGDILRISIPKGTDLSLYSETDIEDVEDWMNNLPRKHLDYLTPEQMFESELYEIYRMTS